MPQRVKCPTGHVLIVPSSKAGTIVRCPRCDESVLVPLEGGAHVAPAASPGTIAAMKPPTARPAEARPTDRNTIAPTSLTSPPVPPSTDPAPIVNAPPATSPTVAAPPVDETASSVLPTTEIKHPATPSQLREAHRGQADADQAAAQRHAKARQRILEQRAREKKEALRQELLRQEELERSRQQAQAALALEKAETEKRDQQAREERAREIQAAEKLAAEKLAAEKQTRERRAAEKRAIEKKQQEKKQQEALAAQQQGRDEQAALEKAAREKETAAIRAALLAAKATVTMDVPPAAPPISPPDSPAIAAPPAQAAPPPPRPKIEPPPLVAPPVIAAATTAERSEIEFLDHGAKVPAKSREVITPLSTAEEPASEAEVSIVRSEQRKLASEIAPATTSAAPAKTPDTQPAQPTTAAIAPAHIPAEMPATPAVASHPFIAPAHVGKRTSREKTIACYQLATCVVIASLFSMGPAIWDVVEYLSIPDATFIARWAILLVMVAVIQIGYAIYLIQLPDWSTVWMVTLAWLATATGYAMGLGLTLISGNNSVVVQALQLGDKLDGGRASLWCLCMMSVAILLAFFAGRLSVRWRSTEQLLGSYAG